MDKPGGFVKMFKCGIDCCKYESDKKTSGKIRRHQANIHDVGIIWYYCDVVGCDYKCDQDGCE